MSDLDSFLFECFRFWFFSVRVCVCSLGVLVECPVCVWFRFRRFVCVNVNRRTTHRTPDRTRGRGTLSHRRDAGLVAGALIDRVERLRGARLPGGMQAEVALDGAAVRNDDRVGHAARVEDAEARGCKG